MAYRACHPLTLRPMNPIKNPKGEDTYPRVTLTMVPHLARVVELLNALKEALLSIQRECRNPRLIVKRLNAFIQVSRNLRVMVPTPVTVNVVRDHTRRVRLNRVVNLNCRSYEVMVRDMLSVRSFLVTTHEGGWNIITQLIRGVRPLKPINGRVVEQGRVHGKCGSERESVHVILPDVVQTNGKFTSGVI